MTKLSDTQLVILSAASRREDRNVLPLPGSLRGGAAAKVVGALLKRGLIQGQQGRLRWLRVEGALLPEGALAQDPPLDLRALP